MLPPEIGIDHGLVAKTCLRGAFRDHAAGSKDRDTIAQLHDYAHDVLDKDDADAGLAHLANDFDRGINLDGIQASQYFVEQQHAGPAGERTR